jgi:hypothetical protein
VNKGSLLADSSPQLMSPSHNDDLCRPLFPGGGGGYYHDDGGTERGKSWDVGGPDTLHRGPTWGGTRAHTSQVGLVRSARGPAVPSPFRNWQVGSLRSGS